jgi:methionyl-tRNA formyltransferase
VWVLKFILEQGIKPLALMVPDKKIATHSQELITLCNYLDNSYILRDDRFRTEEGVSLLNKLKLDYIICVHFPYIFPKKCLEIPKQGVLNLHPAYLPYSRGWHTPTWAIWEETPYGATLHFMSEKVDAGEIIHQKQIKISPDDTADKLYNRVKKLEFEVFKEAWLSLLSGNYSRKPQPGWGGTIHKKLDIESIQFIDLDKKVKAGDLIRRLKALTTNNIKESAYFKSQSKLYRIQLHITEDKE